MVTGVNLGVVPASSGSTCGQARERNVGYDGAGWAVCDTAKFRDAHDALDTAVIEAYRFNPQEDLLAQLLALNLAAASDPEIATAPGGGGRPEAYATTYRLTAG